MRRAIWVIILVLVVGGLVALIFRKQAEKQPKPTFSPEPGYTLFEEKQNMKIESPVFGHNQFIPSKYTCDGMDINPPLSISEVAEGAKSLVLIVDDPDAPMGTWSHWLVWNIDPSVSSIEENSVPQGGVVGLNDFKKNSYGGPCPPSGIHHYRFKLYVLDSMLEILPSSKQKDVERAMENHILGQAELVGLYKR